MMKYTEIDKMDSEILNLISSYGLEGEVSEYFDLAEKLVEKNQHKLATIAYDRAYGLDPSNREIAETRAQLLKKLTIHEHGMIFRFIPAGTFLMGSETGDPDEQPIHPVELKEFWMADVPMDWDLFQNLVKDYPPTEYQIAMEPYDGFRRERFMLSQEHKIRLQYCENTTIQASMDWHRHAAKKVYVTGNGKEVSGEELFGKPARDESEPWGYGKKPMVAVNWKTVSELAEKMSKVHPHITYRLPIEAEWEKAARGGLINKRYPWGNDPPNQQLNCDFNNFKKFSILPSKIFNSNGYGLYSMSGGVWEWTSDLYDANFYHKSPRKNPQAILGKQHVLRGGSWADGAEAVTVSFRNSINTEGPFRSHHISPNVGFRLCREERQQPKKGNR
jgi:formylglycine-generating enzyme required for sulfatase activity